MREWFNNQGGKYAVILLALVISQYVFGTYFGFSAWGIVIAVLTFVLCIIYATTLMHGDQERLLALVEQTKEENNEENN